MVKHQINSRLFHIGFSIHFPKLDSLGTRGQTPSRSLFGWCNVDTWFNALELCQSQITHLRLGIANRKIPGENGLFSTLFLHLLERPLTLLVTPRPGLELHSLKHHWNNGIMKWVKLSWERVLMSGSVASVASSVFSRPHKKPKKWKEQPLLQTVCPKLFRLWSHTSSQSMSRNLRNPCRDFSYLHDLLKVWECWKRERF